MINGGVIKDQMHRERLDGMSRRQMIVIKVTHRNMIHKESIVGRKKIRFHIMRRGHKTIAKHKRVIKLFHRIKRRREGEDKGVTQISK